MKLSSLQKLAMVCIVAATSSAFAKGTGGEALAAKGKTAGTIQITNVNQIQLPSLTIPMVGDQTILPNGIIPSYLSPSGYADLQSLCVNALGFIGQARIKATQYYNMGNNDAAAQALIDGLEKASQELAMRGAFGQRANPATVMAVRHGAALAKFAAKDTDIFKNVLKENTGALKLNLVNQVVELVEDVFEKLDKPYFFTSIGSGHCSGHGCYSGPSRNLPVFRPQYFGKTAEVASKFIELYTSGQGMMGTNLLRLSIASQTSWSAAEILNTSPFRFDYACAVSRLDYINQGIKETVQEYLAMPEGTDQQKRYKERFLFIATQGVNQEMNWALNQVNLQTCQIKKSYKKHGHGYGHGQDDDGDTTVKVKVGVDTDGDGDNDVTVKAKVEVDED